jgi:hypothetical protein
LQRLGNAHLEDSQVHSQPEDVYSGNFAGGADRSNKIAAHFKAEAQFVDDYDDSEF